MDRLSVLWAVVALLGVWQLNGVQCLANRALLTPEESQSKQETIATILRRSIQEGRIDPEPLIYSNDIAALADALHIPEGAQPIPSSNRSSDPDVIVMKDIALAILEGNGRVDVLTEAVLLSVLGKGGHENVNVDELREAIRNNLDDEEFLRKVMEDDTNEIPGSFLRGLLCVDCTDSASWVCNYCWPPDFCIDFWFCQSVLDITTG